MAVNQNNYKEVEMPPSLRQTIEEIRSIMGNSMELLINEVTVSGHDCALVCSEGLVSTLNISNLILTPLTEISLGENSTPDDLCGHIQNKMLLGIDRPRATTYGEFIRFLMSGFALILIDGVCGALCFGVQGYEKRGVSPPSSEADLKGAHEAFTEVVRVNVSLVRRRMKSPTVRFELMKVGSKSNTDVCVVYDTDSVDFNMLRRVKAQLLSTKLETVISSGYLQPFLESGKKGIFHTVGTTERPDVLCSKILEGRIAVLIDGTPFALIVPTLFAENFQTLDDYNCKPYYAVFLRWLRYVGFLIAVFLPGVYIAVALYNPEIFNGRLMLMLASEEAKAPVPLAAEALIMLTIYELIREGGLRLPKAVGGTVGIVGGIIIGDAAVKSGIVSTPLLIVIALSVTASFVIPALNDGITVLRFAVLLAGAIGGFFGISLVLMILLFDLCSAESFGIPIMAPLSPFSFRAMKDVAVREGIVKLQTHNFNINRMGKRRRKENDLR